MNVLITGIAGTLGRIVALQLVARGHQVLGIDRRPWADPPEGVRLFQEDIRKRPAEDVFRCEEIDAVIHMATVTHVTRRSADRFRINLQGTRAVVQYCARYAVRRLIFVGRHTYYGAASDSPLYHTEDEPPMGLESFPELADLVAADLYAGSALWRHPTIDTVVLRMVYTLGPSGHGTLAAFLQGPRVPTVLGFDPLFHFLHEDDAAMAIAMALESSPRGVYNVCGPPPVPLSVLINETGRQMVPVPQPIFHLTLGRFGLPKIPKGAVEHLKYPIVVDGAAFRDATGFHPRWDVTETMTSFAAAHPIVVPA